jgi:prepilin-type N-terminal cleavage/methylation domain-containing protein
MYRRRTAGFTLVELLVVIGIIGLLSTMAVVGVFKARDKAKDTKARAELRSLRNAIALLEADTGKWPNGCPPESEANPEVFALAAQAGMSQPPVVGDQGNGCEWIAQDIARWSGPYMTQATDPWGTVYYFDPDYTPLDNCSGQTALSTGVYLVSFGPNKVGPNQYDCDDIWLQIAE